MPYLPYDILHYIFVSLPAKCLLRLRAVCKTWKHVIDDPFFVKSHTKVQHSHTSSILGRNHNGGRIFSLSLDRLNYADGTQVLDVIPLKQLIHRGVPRLRELPAPFCNGLILLSHHDIKKSWAIWNPLLHNFHVLAVSPPADSDYGGLARYGFGYDEAADDYKVVRVDILYRNSKVSDYYRSLVYSLRSRCWRVIEGFPGGDCLGSRGAFLNGALHWRTRDGIIALDLAGEGHRHRLLPRPPPSIGQIATSLEALDGCLILSCRHKNLDGMDAWVMKDYGTWTKLFSLKFQSYIRGLTVVAYLKTKCHVFLQHHMTQFGDDRALLWLDLNHNSVKSVTIYGSAYTPLKFAQFYPGSLLRLDNTKTRRGVEINGISARFQALI